LDAASTTTENERRCGMKRAIGLTLLTLLFVGILAGLVVLMVADGIQMKIALLIMFGSFVAAVLLCAFAQLIFWLLD
jgi:hypothetical protein